MLLIHGEGTEVCWNPLLSLITTPTVKLFVKAYSNNLIWQQANQFVLQDGDIGHSQHARINLLALKFGF
jgi:hypothetical protein